MYFWQKSDTCALSLNVIKKLVCVFAASAVAFVSGCSDKTDSPQSSVVFSEAETAKDESVDETLGEVRLETPVLYFLGSYDLSLDEQISGAKELYLQTYASEYYDSSLGKYIFPNGSEAVISSEVVSRKRMNDLLSERIQSDNSPDLVDASQEVFSFKTSYMYEDISVNMNLSAPQWEELSDYINAFGIGSKRYYYPWRVETAPERLYYNRTLFEQFSIPDPVEQWQAGEWTWEAFLSAVNTFTVTVNGSIGIYGDELSEGFVLSTGTALISRNESGEFYSQISSENIARAVVWLDENIYKNELYAQSCAGYSSDSALPAAIGLAAFRAADSCAFSEYCKEYSEYDMCNVPYPTDTATAEGAYSVKLFGYLVPTGAKNVQGACCFINCCRIVQAGELSETVKMREMKQNGYTEEEYDFMEQFFHAASFNTVLDLSADNPGAAAAFKDMTARYFSAEEDNSWESICDENSASFERAVAELNALLE